MNTKSSDFVVLQWLVISLNEEMDEIHESWQTAVTQNAFLDNARRFHAIGNVMVVAQLDMFAMLAHLLERVCTHMHEGRLSTEFAPHVLYASRLLYSEINRYVLTGSNQTLLTKLRIRSMQEILQQVEGGHGGLGGLVTEDRFSQKITLTTHETIALSSDDQKKLILAWRHASQKLLAVNQNVSENLQMLAKVAHYAMMSSSTHLGKCVWQLANFWLSSLALNSHPVPQQYAHLLSELDKVVAKPNDDSVETVVWLENLLIDLYIQVGGLKVTTEETHQFLTSLNYQLTNEALFFPHILGMLEGMLFALARGEVTVHVLEEVKEQLGSRGWSFYESYADQIIQDINVSKDDPEMFSQMQWQINTQIQDLYTAISGTYDAIQNKIGESVANTSAQSQEAMAGQLRRVRILIEEVKLSFNDYLHAKDPSILAGSATFDELDAIFDEMNMGEVARIIGKINQLFGTLQTTTPTHLSWAFAHATAESLSLVELFLDGLAKQVFDNALLMRAKESAYKANLILANIDEKDEAYKTISPSADVVRYADAGEIPATLAEKGLADDFDALVADSAVQADEVAAFDMDGLNDEGFEAFVANETRVDEIALDNDIVLDDVSFGDVSFDDPVFDEMGFEEVLADTQPTVQTDKPATAVLETPVFDEPTFDDEFVAKTTNFTEVQITDEVTPVAEVAGADEFVFDDEPNFDGVPIFDDEPIVEVEETNIVIEDEPEVHVVADSDLVEVVGADDFVSETPIAKAIETQSIQEVDEAVVFDDEPDAEDDSGIVADEAVADEVVAKTELAEPAVSVQTAAPAVLATEAKPALPVAEVLSPAKPTNQPEPSQAYLEAKATLKPDEFDFDEDIREIFVDEAVEVLEVLEELLPSWQANPTNLVPLKDIRRGFHTLKGSGRMVGAFSVGEMAWAVENMLNRVLDGTVPSNSVVSSFVADTATLIPVLVQDFANKVPPSIDPANVVLKANNILARRELDEGVFYPDESASETIETQTIQEVQSVTEVQPMTEPEVQTIEQENDDDFIIDDKVQEVPQIQEVAESDDDFIIVDEELEVQEVAKVESVQAIESKDVVFDDEPEPKVQVVEEVENDDDFIIVDEEPEIQEVVEVQQLAEVEQSQEVATTQETQSVVEIKNDDEFIIIDEVQEVESVQETIEENDDDFIIVDEEPKVQEIAKVEPVVVVQEIIEENDDVIFDDELKTQEIQPIVEVSEAQAIVETENDDVVIVNEVESVQEIIEENDDDFIIVDEEPKVQEIAKVEPVVAVQEIIEENDDVTFDDEIAVQEVAEVQQLAEIENDDVIFDDEPEIQEVAEVENDDNVIFDDEPEVQEIAEVEPAKEIIEENDDVIFDDEAEVQEVAKTEPAQETAQPAEMPAGAVALPAVLLPFMAQAKEPVAAQVDVNAVEDDIKEIYIEEASEVLDTIIPLFEEWKVSRDKATLTDVRRGFHTLKGSGRMVGAVELGELAWSIENMLNRVLDGTVSADDGMVALIGEVLDNFGILVGIFEKDSKDYPEKMLLWTAVAHAYSKGHGTEFDYRTLNAQSTQDTAQVSVAEEVVAAEPPKAGKDDSVQVANLDSIAAATEALAKITLPVPCTNEENSLCAVFVEEARELIEKVKDFLDDHAGEDSVAVSDDVVRAFHTLRGATGIPPLKAIGELGAKIESGLQNLQRHDEPMTTKHLQALGSSVEIIERHLRAYEGAAGDKGSNDTTLIDEMMTEGVNEVGTFDVSDLIDGIDTLLDAELDLETKVGQADQVVPYAETILAEIEILDSRTTNLPKFQRLLLSLSAGYQVLALHPEQGINDELVDALLAAQGQLTELFDSLAGSMSLRLDEKVLANLDSKVADIQAYHRGLDDHSLVVDQKTNEKTPADKTDTAAEVVEVAEVAPVVEVKAPIAEVKVAPAPTPVSAKTDSHEPAEVIRFQAIETEPELLEIFLEESAELDEAIGESFGAWKADPSNMDALKALQRHLHTVKGGARMAGLSSIGDLTHEAETIYEQMVDGRLVPSEGWVRVMQGVQDLLSLQLDEVKTNNRSFFADGAVAKLQKFLDAKEVPEGDFIAMPNFDAQQTPAPAEVAVDSTPEAPSVQADLSDFERRQLRSWHGTLPDADILKVFLEEAEELVESSSEDFQAFRSNTGDVATLQILQRKLHTIKGGARMVTATGLADLAHNMETVYEDLGTRRRPATRMVVQLLMACHDFMVGAIVLLKSNLNPPAPTPLIDALEHFSKNPDSLTEVPVVSLAEELGAIAEHEALEKQRHGGRDISRMPPKMGMFELAEDTTNNNEMIRISAPLMERMINLSGEAAINRARIDMSMTGLTASIEEMGVTVQRLHDQLRRMDIELEAQIMAQIDDKTLFEDGDFDPLEMDQYSSLNQLSKSLSESASDLLDLKATMLEKTRDGENLLLQLSRTQTELQDGLMYSRMVPFSRLTPRLQRIVRQVSTELGKKVELKVINADDEMDRTILERITSPLEHMLRNAIDHGVEMPEVREQLGKNPIGTIVLEVTREGSEILINLMDDGAGVNVDAVRKKAIAQGLIAADDTSLSDLDIMQYIFNAGLSTTSVITQISGRGVGMDVVRSEIRQLGGSVSVDSERGKGSKFTMRVPLTVAVSDTLVVRAADRQYAVPLVQIERITQVSTTDLLNYYRSTNATINIDGTPYRLRYLNEILSGHNLGDLAAAHQTLPVILIKNQAGQNLALQVDEIVGSRIEVVVKPLGRQLSHVSGISAATIMGDGSVMFILDLMALVRNAKARVAIEVETPKEDRRPVILVVDDSVTVRKVTSRFLERQGFEAVVAKDGVDALEILQELTPDLMLLDIEMPRMDGFEVATQVRHNARLKELPIIMITSRTGEKHRERAFEIGVTDYMGKPFQENDLLSRITMHLMLQE